jgi:pimeloyl-ACP methyl ester carboxylesterase
MKFAHGILCLGVTLFLACGGSPRAPEPVAKAPEVEVSQGVEISDSLTVGPPSAKLAYWVKEPPKGTVIRGTVIFLHGFLATHTQVENAGNALRKAGYRAVLVDLRGFGKSTGQSITFGHLDATDLRQLTDHLQTLKLCGKTLGVYGTSYGAATAIMYAAADPRVTTVVAVAPFATIRDEVAPFARNALGPLGDFLGDESINALANAVAGRVALDLDTSKPVDAIKKTDAKILLIHGDADDIIPYEASEQLHAANPEGSELLTMAGKGHLELCFDVLGILQGDTRKWYDRYLAK